jgi:hypothetical protein
MTPEDFWNENNKHRDQKFYVNFCLLESTLGDYATARDLHIHNKLNWASTIYYYSLVHALRLICFIALGDFPIGHSDLAKLYKDGELCKKTKWLKQFIKNREPPIQIGQIDLRRDDIVQYFDEDEAISLRDEKLKRWGEILNNARECRNDSN